MQKAARMRDVTTSRLIEPLRDFPKLPHASEKQEILLLLALYVVLLALLGLSIALGYLPR